MMKTITDELDNKEIKVYYCDDCGTELNAQGRMVINTNSEKEYCYYCMIEIFKQIKEEDPEWDQTLFRKDGYNHWEHRNISE